ncbi:uncharacterized protein K441DRAFT_667557 [Cenococcum geophilum 1.58]|uniref:uncharacterized protein n=1 Tax=Cenococcum geophilum 1.58 TaxID=794803 RepID=UPI00358FB428|nr:hypothetical protein K441DRAFT_667557 [Cenococcum geophilum 1.58]
MQSNPSLTFQPLRTLTIVSFAPGATLALIHSIVTHCAFPAVGIIPLFCSAILGLALLHPSTISYGGSAISFSHTNVLTLDFSIAVLNLIFLIYAWVNVPKHQDGGQVMLGTYSTVPQMLNLGIHVYFVLRDVERVVRHTRDCAECRHGMHKHGSAREGYVSLVEDATPYQDVAPYRDTEESRKGPEGV